MKRKSFYQVIWCVLLLTGCNKNSSYPKNRTLNSATQVNLTITGGFASYQAMENAINAFCGIYPNVSIEYEYLQDYNTTLLKRLQSNINIGQGMLVITVLTKYANTQT